MKKVKYRKRGDLRDRPTALTRNLGPKPPAAIPEAVQDIRGFTDQEIEARVYLTTEGVPTWLVKGDFRPVMRRAYLAIERSRLLQRKAQLPPDEVAQWARFVAAYHVCRHTPRAERSEQWPRDSKELAEVLGVPHEKIREAIFQTRYHSWEERYVPQVSAAARVARIKDSLEYNVLRQDEVSDPSKVNANLYRTALQAEGAMVGSQKAVQVNVNSNVLNLPPGLTESDLKARLDRVNRLARALEAKDAEATVTDEGSAT